MEFGNYTLLTKLTPGDNCHGWSLTIPWRVTHQTKHGHPPTKEWSPQMALLAAWPLLAQSDTFWTGLPMFGPICLVPLDPVLPCLVLFEMFDIVPKFGTSKGPELNI